MSRSTPSPALLSYDSNDLTEGGPPRMHINQSKRPLRRGFPLIELLIVIAILLAIGRRGVCNLNPKKAAAGVRARSVPRSFRQWMMAGCRR